MLKDILNLDGAQKLSKGEQQTINGGGHNCPSGYPNGTVCNGLGWVCCSGGCLPEGDPRCFTIGG